MLGNRTLSTRPRAARRAFILFALFALSWTILGAGTAGAKERSVTVMTQNLYQGTEFRHFAALQGKEKVSFEEAIAATTADYRTYLAVLPTHVVNAADRR